ncbi:MAG: hypothetical protein GEU71_03705 [Actinobacteria bacterium]|nr:hypothetical protein [Actinomycetota bacterium]
MPLEAIEFLSGVGPATLMLVGLWIMFRFVREVQKGDWVPHLFYEDIRKERDAWKSMALSGTNMAEKATTTVIEAARDRRP